ncbi:TPA: hypothetical protein ACM9EJ_005322, partial [Escherichia coli]
IPFKDLLGSKICLSFLFFPVSTLNCLYDIDTDLTIQFNLFLSMPNIADKESKDATGVPLNLGLFMMFELKVD